MRVMTDHEWEDDDIRCVECGYGYSDDVRAIKIKSDTTSVLISKQDVITLAKEFNLIIYEKGSDL